MDDPKPETLQLDHAEPLAATVEAVKCASCGCSITDAYFTVGPQTVCAPCRDQVLQQLTTRRGESFGRGLLWGIGGAALGSLLYFAVSKITGYEIGLVGIAAGFLVGHGIRRGSRSLGGRRYQILGAVLTYLAIVTTYVPQVVAALRSSAAADPNAAASASVHPLSQPPPSPSIDGPVAPAPAAPAAPTEPMSPLKALGALALLTVFVFGLAAVAPILAGPANFMGWIIIGFSIWEAWKLNRHIEVPIRGPFRVGAAAGG